MLSVGTPSEVDMESATLLHEMLICDSSSPQSKGISPILEEAYGSDLSDCKYVLYHEQAFLPYCSLLMPTQFPLHIRLSCVAFSMILRNVSRGKRILCNLLIEYDCQTAVGIFVTQHEGSEQVCVVNYASSGCT